MEVQDQLSCQSTFIVFRGIYRTLDLFIFPTNNTNNLPLIQC